MEEPQAIAQSKKRPFEQTLDIQNSPYYKMRALLKDLRPNFIQVLKTPDFRNCKAADDIRQGMKLFMDLYKEMTEESIKLEKCSNAPPVYSSSSIPNGQKPVEHQQDAKSGEHSSPGGTPVELSDFGAQGTYIIGGSAYGWNFTTYPGTGSIVYYGITKEAFRASNPKSTE